MKRRRLLKKDFCAFLCFDVPPMLHSMIDDDILNFEKRVCALINPVKSHPGREKYIAISFHRHVPVNHY